MWELCGWCRGRKGQRIYSCFILIKRGTGDTAKPSYHTIVCLGTVLSQCSSSWYACGSPCVESSCFIFVWGILLVVSRQSLSSAVGPRQANPTEAVGEPKGWHMMEILIQEAKSRGSLWTSGAESS